MSDRVHTTKEIRELVTYGDWGTQEYPGEWFDAWLKSHDAEVERAAAEKALTDAANEWHREDTGTSPRMYQWLRARAEAYRRERGE